MTFVDIRQTFCRNMVCSFEITSPLPVTAGSILTGSVLCNFSKPTKLKEIRVQFHGKEETQTAGHSLGVIYGSSVPVDIDNCILDSETEVPSGISKYGFDIQVPVRIPSTYKHYNLGKIKYLLKAIIKRHNKSDVILTKVINMVVYVDLNTFIPALQIRADFSTDRRIKNMCGKSMGSIMLSVTIHKRLFLIGEIIELDVNIINLSGVKVKKVRCKLIKKVTIYFNYPYPKEVTSRECIAKSVNYPGAEEYEENSYPLFLEIPNDIFVPNFIYSKLFKITYDLQVIATISGLHTSMMLQFKIYMGHIPFFSHDEDTKLHGPYIARGSILESYN